MKVHWRNQYMDDTITEQSTGDSEEDADEPGLPWRAGKYISESDINIEK